MTHALNQGQTHDITLDEVLPHAPEIVWKALTTGTLMARWMMEPAGFEPIVGNRFTFKTTPAGEWDGTIHCEVLEVKPKERFVYAWKGGHPSNTAYGAPLDTVVTLTLSQVDSGTRLRVVHSGFVLPRNDTAFTSMSKGWKVCVERLDGALAGPTSGDKA